jgi:hypothetical protein
VHRAPGGASLARWIFLRRLRRAAGLAAVGLFMEAGRGALAPAAGKG